MSTRAWPLSCAALLAACPVSGALSTTGGSSTASASSASSSGNGGKGSASTGAGGTSTGRATAGSSTGQAASSTGSKSSSSSTGTASGSSTGAATGTASSGGSGACVSSWSTTGGTYYGVLERANDPMRDGLFIDGKLTKSAITGLEVDPTFQSSSWTGPVYSQPLYFVNGKLGKTLVIVTTESNEIYALDATSGSTVWADDPVKKVGPTQVPSIDPNGSMYCGGIISPLGITGTPVIDPLTRTMYLGLTTLVAGKAHHQVYAIDLDDGSTVSGWPVDAEGVTIANSSGSTKFQSNVENQRGALALVDGILYVPYGGLWGDCGPYHGSVVAIPVATPSAVTGWETAADSGGGIWGPSGVAYDGTALFVATGNTNSPFPLLWPDANSEAIIRLALGSPPTFDGTSPEYMAPSDNWLQDDQEDADLGSSGVVLFNVPGASPSDMSFAIGKTGNAYLAQRGNLGGISTGLSEIAGASGQVFGSMAAYTSNCVTYVVALASGNGSCSGSMATFTVSATSPPALGPGWCSGAGGTGSPIVSSSDGTHDYIVWGLDGNLEALDGDSGATLTSVGIPGSYEHWVTPIVAQGAVYVAGDNQVYKFSLP